MCKMHSRQEQLASPCSSGLSWPPWVLFLAVVVCSHKSTCLLVDEGIWSDIRNHGSKINIAPAFAFEETFRVITLFKWNLQIEYVCLSSKLCILSTYKVTWSVLWKFFPCGPLLCNLRYTMMSLGIGLRDSFSLYIHIYIWIDFGYFDLIDLWHGVSIRFLWSSPLVILICSPLGQRVHMHSEVMTSAWPEICLDGTWSIHTSPCRVLHSAFSLHLPR